MLNKVLNNMSFIPALTSDLATFTPKFPSVESTRRVTDITQCKALGTETRLMFSLRGRLERCPLTKSGEPTPVDLYPTH